MKQIEKTERNTILNPSRISENTISPPFIVDSCECHIRICENSLVFRFWTGFDTNTLQIPNSCNFKKSVENFL